jgi:hypothetical protein
LRHAELTPDFKHSLATASIKISFPFPFLLLACFLNFFLLSAIVRWNRWTHDLGQLVFLILFSISPSSWMTFASRYSSYNAINQGLTAGLAAPIKRIRQQITTYAK